MTRILMIAGLIAITLNLLSCAVQTREKANGLSKGMEEQLTNSVESFKSSPIYTDLTEEIIDTTSDDNLLQLVFENLSQKQPSDYKKEYETVMSWNRSRQAIYIIWMLEAEVNNGGFNQFYFNPSGQFYKHIPEVLRLVGATKFADLTNRANETFEKENRKITKHQDRTLEGYSKSYDDNQLNKFDDEFYDLHKVEHLQQLQIDFIRKNKKEFIDK